MSDKEPMICPHCGATMNHHATKVDYNVEATAADEVFGGALEEVHTCPGCGRIELRRAAKSPRD
jgi:predicted RNA-binding Zn-ribbon protein involved in translation (DUF1610 family)